MGSDNFRGAVLMVSAMVLFAIEDMFIKLLTATLSVTQVLAIIGGVGFVIFWGVLLQRGGRLFTQDLLRPVVVVRNLAEAVGSLSIVAALALSDLSSTSAIMQALPLALVLGAALFLGEPVGPRRYAAIAVGFIGVLLVIRPGLDGFTPVSLIAVVAVIALAVRDLATRRIPATVRSEQIAASAFAAIFLTALIAAPFDWQGFATPNLSEIAMSIGCVGSGVLAYAMLVSATRVGEASALAPFRYTRLVFAMIFAVLVFGERPDVLTIAGATLIAGSGGYAMWREALLRRRARRASSILINR